MTLVRSAGVAPKRLALRARRPHSAARDRSVLARSGATLFALVAACGTPASKGPQGPDGTGDGTAGDGSGSAGDGSGSNGPPVVETTLAAVGLDESALDRTADPCDDFYQYSCGGWIANTEIPADKPMWMRSFLAIEERNTTYLHDLLEQARTAPGDDAGLAKIGAYYGACMDEAAIGKAGLTPIKSLRDAIGKVSNGKTLARAVAALHDAGVDVLFNLRSTQDARDATKVIAGISQGGLGLPDRDYYLKDDEQTKALRDGYRAYVTTILTLGGASAKAAAQGTADVMAVETALAGVSLTSVERRDPEKTYNRLERDGVSKVLGAFPWKDYAAAAGVTDVVEIDVNAPGFLAGIAELTRTVKPAAWKSYLTFHALAKLAPLLGKELEDAQFGFIQMITGTPEQEPRWKRCTRATDAALGEVVGQYYVKDRFPGDSRDGAEIQIKAISAAFGDNVGTLTWMDDATRAKARGKLDAMFYQIGYPATWRHYDFEVGAASYAKNALASTLFEHKRQLAKIGKPVDRAEWQMTAATVNAYYEPQLNEMVFPAGILQPPFYSRDFAIPVNLGAMGVVVGHELTHGFDDQGAQYDAAGNLANWWSPSVGEQFKSKTSCVADQYSRYEALPGVPLNGKLTLGENIADIGGLKMAFGAYRQLRANATEVTRASGFDEDQQFFLGFGQAWCSKTRDELARLLVTVDPHSPGHWRVNGAVSDNPAFAKAFNCKAGARMAPKNACTVW